MIAYIKGEVTDIDEDRIIVECGNIGYNIFVTGALMSNIGVIGSEVKVYTYLNVKEDAMNLYGFSTKDELRIFKLLIGVNGIGPKGAMGILSFISPDELRMAVIAGDSKTISKAPGIGAKTAMKLIIELKDKLKLEDYTAGVISEIGGNSVLDDNRKDAIEALVALGYSQAESTKAVRAVKADKDIKVEEILKLALREL